MTDRALAGAAVQGELAGWTALVFGANVRSVHLPAGLVAPA
jgi:hypothetical protein